MKCTALGNWHGWQFNALPGLGLFVAADSPSPFVLSLSVNEPIKFIASIL